ncbi:MAG: class I SAM-dependent methyltransferase [Actinomycetota bacterium]
MADDQKTSVQRQFAASVAGYVTSDVHARGDDLARLPAIVGLTGVERVLDVATAVGHAAFALAPFCREVIGVDLTEEMLAEARCQAAARGLANVSFQAADAERLPFSDAAFDVVTCRIAAHHFPDAPAFCRESARVLRAGGRLLVVDNVAPEDDELDRFINSVEKLRDPSHFREHRLSEWGRFFAAAGFRFEVERQFISPIDREDWLRRMHVPADTAEEVCRRLSTAPERVKEAFGITDTHFNLFKAVMVGVKQ